MAMEISSVYSSYATSAAEGGREKRVDRNNTEKNIDNEKKSNTDYLSDLQRLTPYIRLRAGDGLNQKKDSQVNVVDVSPKLLEKMQKDPEVAKKYSQRLKDVEVAYKWADSYHKMKGNTVVCRHGYVDENGNFSNFAVIKKNDGLNEKLRKEAEENAKKQIEKTRENLKKKAEELEEKIEEKEQETSVEEMIDKKLVDSEDGSIYLDDKEMQQVILKAKEENAKKETGTYLDLQV